MDNQINKITINFDNKEDLNSDWYWCYDENEIKITQLNDEEIFIEKT